MQNIVATPPTSSYKCQKHVTIHLPPSTLPPLFPTPNIPPTTFHHYSQHLIALSSNPLIHLSINSLTFLIMTNKCIYCLNIELPLIPPTPLPSNPWDSKINIWMPLSVKPKILLKVLKILMPQRTKAKNQSQVHSKIYPNPYLQMQSTKAKWFGYLRINQASQMRHHLPHLKKPNHPLPSKNPPSKEKIIKILSLCGYLNL